MESFILNQQFKLQNCQRQCQRYRRKIYRIQKFQSSTSGPLNNPLDQPLNLKKNKEQEQQQFPRLNVRDPHERLGVQKEADFEEIQEARNYLMETYGAHGPSKDAIEMAFDSILKDSIKVRNKEGFKPPQTGKRTDARPENKESMEDIMEKLFEQNVAVATIVNEMFIQVALGAWAIAQLVTTSIQPSLPLGISFMYTTYKLYNKKRQRGQEESKFFWLSLGQTILGALLTVPIWWVARFLFPNDVIAFCLCLPLCLGLIQIFVK